MKKIIVSSLSLAIAASLSTACGPVFSNNDENDMDGGVEDGGDNDGGNNDGGSSEGMLISAANGGTVTLGNVSLVIPPDALSEDTRITSNASSNTSSLPDADNIVSDVYSFGPSGTTFSIPAVLSIPAPNVIPENGTVYTISVMSDNDTMWTDLLTKNENGMLKADVTHFSRFVIRVIFTDGPIDGACGEFTACGGDPVGVWTLSGACFAANPNPLSEQCPSATFGIEVDTSGVITINTDNTYINNMTLQMTSTYILPAICLPLADFDCTNINDDCIANSGAEGGCLCTEIQEPSTNNETGTWSVDGNNLIITESDSQKPTTAQFCANSSSLDIYVFEEALQKDGSLHTTTVIYNLTK